MLTLEEIIAKLESEYYSLQAIKSRESIKRRYRLLKDLQILYSREREIRQYLESILWEVETIQ